MNFPELQTKVSVDEKRSVNKFVRNRFDFESVLLQFLDFAFLVGDKRCIQKRPSGVMFVMK